MQSEENKSKMVVGRYMDDIICIYANEIDIEQFVKRFESECYPAPLKLTNEDNDHFLECEVIDKDGLVHFKHGNKNKGLEL